MSIETIVQIISTIPEAGHRGVDVQTVFVNKQEDFQDHLQGTTVAELNALKTQINTTVNGMNDAVVDVTTKSAAAVSSATSASGSATTATTKAGEASTSATKAGQWADNNWNVPVESGKYSAKHWATEASNAVISTNITRPDKYLAAQNVANMVYNGSGKLTKVQYINATDVDYEVLTYNGSNKLTNVAHYTSSTLRGNTVLTYSAGKLLSAIYTGV